MSTISRKAMRQAKKQNQLMQKDNTVSSQLQSSVISIKESRQMAQFEANRKFTCFNKLAAELRIKIWRMAANEDRGVGFIFGIDRKNISEDTYQFKPCVSAPSMLFVSFEARQIGLEHFTRIVPSQTNAVVCRDGKNPAEHLSLYRQNTFETMVDREDLDSVDEDGDPEIIKALVEIHFAPFYINTAVETITFIPGTQMLFEESLDLIQRFAAKLGLARYKIDLRTLLAEIPRGKPDIRNETLGEGMGSFSERIWMDSWFAKQKESNVLKEVVLRCGDETSQFVLTCLIELEKKSFRRHEVDTIKWYKEQERFAYKLRKERTTYATIACIV